MAGQPTSLLAHPVNIRAVKSSRSSIEVQIKLTFNSSLKFVTSFLSRAGGGDFKLELEVNSLDLLLNFIQLWLIWS